MNISFIATEIEVMEGAGVVTLMLKKTEGAIGPVSIRIFSVEGTAIGMLRNYSLSSIRRRHGIDQTIILNITYDCV